MLEQLGGHSEEFVAVAGVARRGGGHHVDALDAELAHRRRVAGQRDAGALDRLIGEAPRHQRPAPGASTTISRCKSRSFGPPGASTPSAISRRIEFVLQSTAPTRVKAHPVNLVTTRLPTTRRTANLPAAPCRNPSSQAKATRLVAEQVHPGPFGQRVRDQHDAGISPGRACAAAEIGAQRLMASRSAR